MIGIHYLIRGIVLEISNEIAKKKNPTKKKSVRKPTTMSRKNRIKK